MKKTIVFSALLLSLVAICLALSSCGDTKTLNVYNWGMYISDGKDGTYDTVGEFEKWYEETYGEKIKVNYTTFDSNEDMLAKIKSGATDYDVIVPSDYMIQRMKDENLLAKLNFDNIPNYQYIGDQYRNLYFDENNEYSVPYTYGVLGIIYNANVVDPAVVEEKGWSIFWDEAYAGKILMINNSRDAFGISMYDQGIDVNTTDKAQWDKALSHLMEGKSNVQAFVMDEVFNKMQSGEAAICAYYAGDYFTMVDAQSEGVDLRFYQPEVTNVFVDSMCIPASSTNKELAEIFINFMLSKDAAIANAEYIYYASPNTLVSEDPTYQEDMGEEAMAALYKEDFDFNTQLNRYGYRNLDNETLEYINNLWEQMKIESSGTGYTVYIVVIAVVVVAAGLIIFFSVRKKKRSQYDDE
ncbi:MAG: PotD/PotF family extracellular solute-binding protein [Eubacteriales bacterium]